MQKKSSRPSCFKAAMALLFAVVFFISGCSVGSGTEPSATPTSVPITQVPTTPGPENVGNGEVRDGSLVNVQPKCTLHSRIGFDELRMHGETQQDSKQEHSRRLTAGT